MGSINSKCELKFIPSTRSVTETAFLQYGVHGTQNIPRALERTLRMSFSMIQSKQQLPKRQRTLRSKSTGHHKAPLQQRYPCERLKNKSVDLNQTSETKVFCTIRSSNRKNLTRLEGGIKNEMTLLPFHNFRTQIEFKPSSHKSRRDIKTVRCDSYQYILSPCELTIILETLIEITIKKNEIVPLNTVTKVDNTPYLNDTTRNDKSVVKNKQMKATIESIKNKQMKATIESGVNQSPFRKSLQNLSMAYPWLSEFFKNELTDPVTAHAVSKKKGKSEPPYICSPATKRPKMATNDAKGKIFVPISTVSLKSDTSNSQDTLHKSALNTKTESLGQVTNPSLVEQKPFINADEIRLLRLSFQDDKSPFHDLSSESQQQKLLKGVVTPEQNVSLDNYEQPSFDQNLFLVDFFNEKSVAS